MNMGNNLNKAFAYIPKIYNEPDRKSFFLILKEIIQLTIKCKTFPSHYFSRRLYKNNIGNINNYIPNNILYTLHAKINDINASQVLENKLFFWFYYGEFFDNLAKILLYNNGDIFINHDNYFHINDIHEFEDSLLKLVDKRSSAKSIFIKKTYDSHGGANTYRISKNDFPLDRDFLNNLLIEVKSSSYLFQETIKQHKELNRLNPSCVNTIRMDTFINKNGVVEVIGPYLRVSINNLHVDNTSSGGCCIGIDIDSGKLKKYGYTSISKTGGNTLTEHPITKVIFEDFQIPFYKEAVEFIRRVAFLTPKIRLVGWDLAITETGPVLIEGNPKYDITNHDLVHEGYRNNPVFSKILDELKII